LPEFYFHFLLSVCLAALLVNSVTQKSYAWIFIKLGEQVNYGPCTEVSIRFWKVRVSVSGNCTVYSVCASLSRLPSSSVCLRYSPAY